MSFKPIMAGIFNAMSVNRKLREIWAAIEVLNEAAGITDEEPAPAPETETADSAETVVIEQPPEPEEPSEPEFDWKTTNDVGALKDWAVEMHGLEIKGNKKPETVRAEINAHMQAALAEVVEFSEKED